MSCTEILVGDAIKALLISEGVGVWANVERTHLALFDVEDLDDPMGPSQPKITIRLLPTETAIRRMQRGGKAHWFDVSMDVGLLRRIRPDHQLADGDVVMDAAEAIEDALRDKDGNAAPLPTLTSAEPLGVERRVMCDRGLLKDKNVFLTVVTARYCVQR